MLPQHLFQAAKDIESECIRIRHELHAHPETGFALKKTKELVKNELIRIGCAPQDCGKSGVTALVGGQKTGKVFLLRADMDALPIPEETTLPFASANENMHACGHDMHTAMLLGAAMLLKKYEHELNGTVKLMFQPAEELLEGAKDMICSGVLQNPPVDAAMMLHVMSNVPLPIGTVLVCDGGVSAPAADYFTIHVQGKGCHGSTPSKGIDPITAASHIVTALQEIAARELFLFDAAALTIGIFQAGNAANVIPDTAVLKGTLRAHDEEVRSYIKKRLTEIAEGIASSFRAAAAVSFTSGCPTLDNDPDLSQCVLRYTKELLSDAKALLPSKLTSAKDTRNSGSEDFAYLSHEVPSLMVALAAGEPQKGYCYPLHHPKVMFDDHALMYGSAVYAYTAMKWLHEHSE